MKYESQEKVQLFCSFLGAKLCTFSSAKAHIFCAFGFAEWKNRYQKSTLKLYQWISEKEQFFCSFLRTKVINELSAKRASFWFLFEGETNQWRSAKRANFLFLSGRESVQKDNVKLGPAHYVNESQQKAQLFCSFFENETDHQTFSKKNKIFAPFWERNWVSSLRQKYIFFVLFCSFLRAKLIKDVQLKGHFLGPFWELICVSSFRQKHIFFVLLAVLNGRISTRRAGLSCTSSLH